MPSDRLDGGGGELIGWEDENALLHSTPEHWFPATSASPSNLIYYSSNFEGHPPVTDASARNPAGLGPAGTPNDAFFHNPYQSFEFDIHQGQHWSDVPTQDNVTTITAVETASTSVGGDWAVPLPLGESPRDSIGSVAEVLSKAGSEKTTQQDLNISRSLLSPSRSVVSSKNTKSESLRPQRASKPLWEEPRTSRPPLSTQMTSGSGYNSPTAGQGGFDRRKNPGGPRATPSNRLFSRNPFEPQNEEEQRRKQFDLDTRGPSRMSSISGHSRGENETVGSDAMDDEFTSSMSRRSENRGAGTTPGVLRTRQGDGMQNGQRTLPHAKGFSIQIGSEIFKLSGASIMSDGQYKLGYICSRQALLRILEHPHIFQSFSRSSFSRERLWAEREHYILIETL